MAEANKQQQTLPVPEKETTSIPPKEDAPTLINLDEIQNPDLRKLIREGNVDYQKQFIQFAALGNQYKKILDEQKKKEEADCIA